MSAGAWVFLELCNGTSVALAAHSRRHRRMTCCHVIHWFKRCIGFTKEEGNYYVYEVQINQEESDLDDGAASHDTWRKKDSPVSWSSKSPCTSILTVRDNPSGVDITERLI